MSYSIEIGTFEAQGISGVSIARGPDVLGIRMTFPHFSLGLFDDKDLLLTLDRMEPHAAGLGYVSFSWHVPVTRRGRKAFGSLPREHTNMPAVYDFEPGDTARVRIEWRKSGDGKVEGRYTSDMPVRAALIANGCFESATILEADAAGCRLKLGGLEVQLRLAGKVETPFLANTRLEVEQKIFGLETPAGAAMAVYPVEFGPDSPLYFTMVMDAAAQQPVAAAIDTALAEAAARLKRGSMRSSGLCAGSAEAVSALAGYSRCYDPAKGRIATTVNRTWTGPNRPAPIFGWDNFFTTYIAAWDDPELAARSLEHIVSVYGEHGIANGPTQRNLIIPVMYRKTLDLIGDRGLASRTWPTMMEFMRFWFARNEDGIANRDGNGDGLIEAGSSFDPLSHPPGVYVQNAMDETGYDETPIYSDGFTDKRRALPAEGVDFDLRSKCLTLGLVCQNSLYVASCKAMATIADWLGETADAAWLRDEAGRVAAAMKEKLFDESTGIFMNRFWSGGFSRVKAMTIFFPLLADVADEEVRTRLRSLLLDPKHFWGDNLVPTVSRNDPSYCDGIDGTGNYWRGNCWPPTTYMVWLSAREAGWDDVSAMIAEKVNRQFMTYWRRHGHAYENYPAKGPVNHTRPYPFLWGGRELRYVWSAMLPLCALEEIFAPESVMPGLRFGNPHLPKQSDWRRFKYNGKSVKASAGPLATTVEVSGGWKFDARPGVTVREFVATEQGYSFRIPNAPTEIEISVGEGVPIRIPAGTRDATFQIPARNAR